jgi:electron transfer flavoprotein alpha subunit/transcriptional regulator with XRE-family HTH domain
MKKNINNEIWVYGDLRNRRLFNFSLNVLAKARDLAWAKSGKAVMILMGGQKKEPIEASFCLSPHEEVDTCLSHGADRVILLESTELICSRADIRSRALTDMIKARSPRAVFFALSDLGREIAARCARMCDAGLMADCAELRIKKDDIIAGCPSWGGEIMAQLTYSDPSITGFATVQPHAFRAVEVKGDPGTVEKIRMKGLKMPEGLRRTSFSEEPLDRRKLEDADIVVVGGAGLGNLDGFRMVNELAAAIGGEVAATRPSVLNHWADDERMIGQTGKTVRPELLFSVGTSGAVQYTSGIAEAKNIVAINRDPESQIFQTADIGIVADAKSFLPIFTDRVKQIVMRRLADVLSDNRNNKKDTGFGLKISELRKAQSWSLEDLAQQTSQPPEFIKQVENDEIVPPVSFLLRLAGALKCDPGTFLKEEEKVAIRDQRAQAFVKRTKNYFYQTLTPGAENEHLRGFMITIEPNQDLKPVAYKHEGEEFVYVMEGDLELTLDNRANHLKVGECMHYNSEIPHKLKSLSNETTRCLVILYTP